jgi:hypothetical protein
VVSPAESENLAALDRNTAARDETAQAGGELGAAAAAARVQAADRTEWAAEAFLQERNRIAREATERIKSRQEQANADYQAYKDFGIKDPQADDKFGTRILKAIVIGMGQYASGIGGGPNVALNMIQEANRENINRQKAQQEKLFQAAQRSDKDVAGARAERDDAFKQLDLKHAALLESSAAILRKELARIGVPQAQVDANKEIQTIEREALGIRERTLQSIRDDETNLAKADILAAGRRGRGTGAGGGGGDPKLAEDRAKLAEYAVANPQDSAGLRRLAAKLDPRLGEKDISTALNQNKIPEGAQGTATKAKAALDAIDRIDKMGYTPSRQDIQTWLNNQRQVAAAEEAGKKGGAGGLIGSYVAGKAQGAGILAQNEYDGLSPRARLYFTNVRQYMENIGREASGAAISQGEWNNFYGQYGPQSEGGLAAARENIRNRFKLTGAAGRSLEAPSAAPAGRGSPGGGGKPERQESDAIKQARQIINDEGAAKRAAKESGQTVQQIRARATLYLRQNNAADIVL